MPAVVNDQARFAKAMDVIDPIACTDVGNQQDDKQHRHDMKNVD